MRNPLSQIHSSLYLIKEQIPYLNTQAAEHIKDAHKVIQNDLQVLDITMDAIKEKPIDPDSLVLLSARDTGPGIAPEAIPKLFNSFYTAGKQGGTGLGLSYCKRTINALGGDIRCESELGKHTAFTLSFPVVPTLACKEKLSTSHRLDAH